jgi:hypothetical protein
MDTKETFWSDYDEILETIQRRKKKKKGQAERLLDNSSLVKKDD